MQISFFGAAREVTGSCFELKTKKSKLLIDCGMFQGGAFAEAKNFQAFGFDAKTIDAVAVTHAHLDHVGRLPKLAKEGFRGKIYATPPTIELAKLVLMDAWHIMKEDFRREYRPMLYEEKDVEFVMKQFTPVEYSRTVKISDISFRFRDAGHIFGSAFIEVEEKGGSTAAFSGDLGNEHVPILRDTAQLAAVDALVMESTYGSSIHEDESTRKSKLQQLITRVAKNKGVLVIPAFAIERTQQLLYELHRLVERKLVPSIDVYLDSPMAIDATKVIKSFPQYYDQEALNDVMTGNDFFDFPGLRLTYDRDQSKTINQAPRPKVIIAGSGMMNGGRILHHLVRYLGDTKSVVLIVGYQSEGTLGRRLYRGDKIVDVLGERVHVKAEIDSIGAYSAHADQNKLVRWVETAEKMPKQVFLTHGDESSSLALATRLERDLDIHADVPRFGDIINV